MNSKLLEIASTKEVGISRVFVFPDFVISRDSGIYFSISQDLGNSF